jgi:hypothetical protein
LPNDTSDFIRIGIGRHQAHREVMRHPDLHRFPMWISHVPDGPAYDGGGTGRSDGGESGLVKWRSHVLTGSEGEQQQWPSGQERAGSRESRLGLRRRDGQLKAVSQAAA